MKNKPNVFVPSVELAQGELGLSARFGLDEALLRTLQWYGV